MMEMLNIQYTPVDRCSRKKSRYEGQGDWGLQCLLFSKEGQQGPSS